MPVITIKLYNYSDSWEKSINTKFIAYQVLGQVFNPQFIQQCVTDTFNMIRFHTLLFGVHRYQHCPAFRVFIAAFKGTIGNIVLPGFRPGWRPFESFAAYFANMASFVSILPLFSMFLGTKEVYPIFYTRFGKIYQVSTNPTRFCFSLPPVHMSTFSRTTGLIVPAHSGLKFFSTYNTFFNRQSRGNTFAGATAKFFISTTGLCIKFLSANFTTFIYTCSAVRAWQIRTIPTCFRTEVAVRIYPTWLYAKGIPANYTIYFHALIVSVLTAIVKFIFLMRYLCRMITPPNGVILDMFGGSGSTAVACIHEGFNFILVEQSEEYVNIANARVAHAYKTMTG